MDWVCRLVLLGIVVGVLGCESFQEERLFTRLAPSSTGVTFSNEVEDQRDRHLLNFFNMYNGGGVAVGDVNGNGRPDLYFTANMGPNKLYVNEGDFRFRDVTETAGVVDTLGWTTGVTMVDVNGDGHLDMYVCKSGNTGDTPRRNLLYVNNGDGTFTERAEEYGLDSDAYSVHGTFFDYDRDGDLDLFLLNNPAIRESRISSRVSAQQRRKFENDNLYRNDLDSTGSFTDVTEESGLLHDSMGFGLSATVSDVNKDGWLDVYVANDTDVEDRLYINQGDGTFEESIHEHLDHMPRSSMGADIADYNNDGWPDIFVADMLPEDNRRQKLLNIGQRPRAWQHVQFVRNMLQLNNKNGSFSEIGQLAGVAKTDWSWASLFADFDLDGHKDLYVTNGMRYDYTNMDFQFSDYVPALREAENAEEIYSLVGEMPSTPIPNYIFQNRGDLTFEKQVEQWGMSEKGFSSGAAYADLNGDGALDLVVNNVDEQASIYRNEAPQQTDRRSLRVDLKGTGQNTFGVGAEVEVTTPAGRSMMQELIPARGFQSSMEPVLTFGVGTADTVQVTVTWPDGTREVVEDVQTNQSVTLHQENAEPYDRSSPTPDRQIERLDTERRGLDFTHEENSYEDYHDQPLMTHMVARLGPALARGDVNGDGRQDVFVGGARGQSSAIYVQSPGGTFDSLVVDAFDEDAPYEDVDAIFVDVNNNGRKDLYVVSGGRSEVRSEAYQDRLYINQGNGRLERDPNRLPAIESSGGAVAAHDFDGDGDVDLFVGGRARPLEYPLSPKSYLLQNEGGEFEDVTDDVAEALRRPGMVTDAKWADLTGDDRNELVLGGEWMPIRVFRHENSVDFREITAELGLKGTNGWWNRLAIADLDGDVDPEIIVGNRGNNAQLQASPEKPVSAYVADFDEDRDIDLLMSHYNNGKEVPVARRNRMMDAFTLFRARFPTYESYAEARVQDVLSEDQWEKAELFQAYTFATSVFDKQDDGTFVRRDLPVEAQFSPTHGIVVRDLTGDGQQDVILAGNDFTVRRPWGPSNAGKGLLLVNEGDLSFEARRSYESGFFAPGDIRDVLLVPTGENPLVVVGNNDAPLDLFEIRLPVQQSIVHATK